jgi:hypothetical protein
MNGITTKRIGASIAGGLACGFVLHLMLPDAKAGAFVAALSTFLAWCIYLLISGGDLEDSRILLPEGEKEIGRTTKNFELREPGFLFLAKRSPIPWRYSAIITNRRIIFYALGRWYDEIWFKNLQSIEYAPASGFSFSFSPGGTIREIVFASNHLQHKRLLEMFETAGVEVKKTLSPKIS